MQGVFDLDVIGKEDLVSANSKITELQKNVEAERKIRIDVETTNSSLVFKTEELVFENENLKEELEENKSKCQETYSYLEEIARLRAEVSAMKQLQRENYDLRRKCSEQEQALVELGDHLSKSKVKAEELKHHVEMTIENKWVSDKDQVICQQCNENFSVSRRRHHCRNCGGIFCHQCSDNTMPLPSSSRPLRVCDSCADLLLQRSVVLATYVVLPIP